MKKIDTLLVFTIIFSLAASNVAFAEEAVPKQDNEDITVWETNTFDNEDMTDLDISSIASGDISSGLVTMAGYRVVVRNGNLNVRSDAGTNYPVIGRFAKGSIVYVDYISNDKGKWWIVYGIDVSTGRGIRGWVDSTYLVYNPGSGT